MDIHYQHRQAEKKWYNYWLEHRCFASTPNQKKPYTVVMPPPNVTGILHMGHVLNNTIQDVLVRRARLKGYNACWVPGTDHASIATEARVVKRLQSQKIDKFSLTREQFLEHAWDWTKEYGDIIFKQLQQLGVSCDWDRKTFTLDEHYSQAVTKVFIDLYEKGLIYRGLRMVNWDPVALTAISDEEVIFKEESNRLFYLRYPIVGTEEFLIIATTRPETIFADAAVAVHPQDERYQKYIGKTVKIPLLNKEIPIIADDYVDPEFGTGCLKITPAHDKNDYILGKKYNLPFINLMHPNGILNENAGKYEGQDRFQARKLIFKDLQEASLLEKEENYHNKVGYSERTNAVIEPRISLQWFCKMEELAKPALKVVKEHEINFHPKKFENTYRAWMENIQDWCISRQLWWGHRIPVYYFSNQDSDFVVAETAELALKKAQEKSKNPNLKLENLHQDEDVMDTWFSAWLWPLEVFKGLSQPYNSEFLYYYPTADLVTAPEILFFWVARMIMAGEEYTQKIPFKNVYYTGIVRDKQGRKMSKSLGNSPDPLELMDQYGADAVRIGMLFSSPAGNDLLFDEALCEQGRNFAGKIWNAFRLVKGWTVEEKENSNLIPEENREVIRWMNSKINQSIQEVENCFERFKISEALMIIYKLFWDDFCAWYLEFVKPPFGEKIDKTTYKKTVYYFEELMKLLHPFMPFITEDIYHHLQENRTDDICVAKYPNNQSFDNSIIAEGEKLKEIISAIRDTRNKNGLSPKVTLKVYIQTQDKSMYDKFGSLIIKIANIHPIEFTENEIENTVSQLIQTDKIFIETGIEIDAEIEKKKIQQEIEYYQGFIAAVEKKLSNEKFVANAKPEIIDNERKKLADGQLKLQALKESWNKL